MKAKEKQKVVIFIVEGDSEQEIFHDSIKKILEPKKLHLEVYRGDCLTDIKNKGKQSKEIIGNIVRKINMQYKFKPKDIVSIIQVTDLDGSMLNERNYEVNCDLCIKNKTSSFYDLERKLIVCESDEKKKNLLNAYKTKNEHLKKLIKTKTIMKSEFRIFYFKFNLEHVTKNKLVYSNDEKEKFAREIGEKFTDINEFKKFFTNEKIFVSSDYLESWKKVLDDSEDFSRKSNINVLIEYLEKL